MPPLRAIVMTTDVVPMPISGKMTAPCVIAQIARFLRGIMQVFDSSPHRRRIETASLCITGLSKEMARAQRNEVTLKLHLLLPGLAVGKHTSTKFIQAG
jgi:hypothetical protein